MLPYRQAAPPRQGEDAPESAPDLALADRVIHLLLIFVGALPVLHALRTTTIGGAGPALGLCAIAVGVWALRCGSD